MVPLGWRETTVGASAKLIAGFPFASARFSSSGVRLIRGSNVKRGEIDWSTDIAKYWPLPDGSLRAFELTEGDILVAMDGALVGRSYARIREEYLPAYLVQRVARLRGTAIDQDLLYAWIGSERFASYVDSVKTHTAIPHISPRDIREFPIRVPGARAEQISIANALADIGEMILMLERLIAKKRAIKHGVMRELLSGRTRLVGFADKWEKVRLKDVATVSRGASPRPIASARWFSDSSKVGWVRIADLGRSDGITLRTTTQRLSAEGIARSRFLPPGTLIMSIAATVGVPIITGIPTCIHDGFVALEQLHGVNQTYLLCLLKSMEGEIRSAGQTGSQANVNTEIVRGLHIWLPSQPEQRAIAETICDADKEIATLQHRLAKVSAIKRGMMHELLTGRTRLPVTEAVA